MFLGHSAYGQILTLCIYMGSIGIGSFIGAALAKRSRSPLGIYALIELAAGIGGLCFHECYVAATEWFYHWGMLGQLSPTGITVAKLTISIVLTCPVAILLGMTFPCLAIALMRLQKDSGASSLPTLYFVNSLGAAFGIMLASYVLIATFGTAGTLRVAGMGNLVLAAGFWLVGRGLAAKEPEWERAKEPMVEGIPGTTGSAARETSSQANADSAPHPPVPAPPRPHVYPSARQPVSPSTPFFLLLAALTGFSSFVYEISWIRLLSLVLGSATHSFDIMVSAFILGLALGGLYSRKLIARSASLPVTLALVQVAMGVCAMLTIYCYKPFFLAMNRSHWLFALDDTGYVMVSIYKYLLCLGLMLPACFCAGMTLPLVTCHLTRATGDEKYTGTVYGWNTVGAILGASLGGLVLLPALQLKMTIAAGAVIDLVLGIVLLTLVRARARAQRLVWAATVLALAPVFFFSFEQDVLVAGQYRHPTTFPEREGTVVRDGATATISFQRKGTALNLKSNGKVDASLKPDVTGERQDDEYTQAGVAFIPMALMPDRPYTAAMIGFGSGMTAHHLLGDDRVQRLDIVEIEREVPRVARGFYPYNRRSLDDPRVRLVIDDAKSFFHATRARYDLIISEPTNPWVSGVAGLFTREFYERIKGFLHDDGILIQWMHLYDFNTPLLLTIFKALQEQFPQWELYKVPQGSDIVIVAWRGPSRTMNWEPLEKMTGFQEDLAFLDVDAETFGLRRYVFSQKTLARLLEPVAPNSDFIPLVENGAEKAMFLDTYVDLIEPFVENCTFYQEVLEPDAFALPLEAIRRHRAAEPYDTATARLLHAHLDHLDAHSNWEWIDSVFYQTAHDYACTPRWLELDLVERYRDTVYAGAPPSDVQYRFTLIDFVSRGMHHEAAALVSDMVDHYAISDAGASLIRTMAVEALRSGDRGLYERFYCKFVDDNTELFDGEREFLESLRGRVSDG